MQDGLESLNPYPYSTPREPGTAGQAEELAASMMFVSPDSYTSGFLDPLWIFPSLDQLLAPRIVFRPWTIATSQRGFYSRGIYVYVPQGQSLQVLLVNGSNPPTPLVEAQSDGPFVRYPPPPAAEGAQIFRVGVSPMPPADTIPVLGPTPATRYRFAAAAGLTERRILLLRSGGMEAYLEMSPTALTQWTPAAPPAGGGGVVTAGPPPTYSNVPIARAVPNRPDAQRYADSPTLADIIVRHLGPPIGWNGRGPRPSRDPYICANPGTSGHETVHFINNYIYWEYGNRQGMYFGNGNGAAIREVTGNLNGVLALVPHSLRGSRVRTYFGSSRRDVTWLFDEANAYMLDAEIAIELRNYPNWDRSIAEGEGAGEFIGYSLATLMYIEQGLGQPRTLSEQDLTQMRNAVRLNIERAAAAFKRALEIRSSHPHLAGGRSDFLTRLRDDATAQGNALRAFAVRTYGQAWFNAIVDMTPSGTP